MRYSYMGIVENVNDTIEVFFPDLNDVRTFGDDYEDAMMMASDLLETYLSYLIENGLPVPKAKFDHQLGEGQEAAYFTVSAPVEQMKTMTVAEAAELLGVTPRRVNAMINDGVLTAVKEGRDNMVSIASVDARLASPPKRGRPRKTAA